MLGIGIRWITTFILTYSIITVIKQIKHSKYKTFFSTVPYCNDIDHEGHWQQMLYVVFSLLGAKGDVEMHTATGRVDIAVVMWSKLYLMEIKLDKPAKDAMAQINFNEYDKRFACYDLPIVKLGICFSTKERTITEWAVEE